MHCIIIDNLYNLGQLTAILDNPWEGRGREGGGGTLIYFISLVYYGSESQKDCLIIILQTINLQVSFVSIVYHVVQSCHAFMFIDTDFLVFLAECSKETYLDHMSRLDDLTNVEQPPLKRSKWSVIKEQQVLLILQIHVFILKMYTECFHNNEYF